MRSLAATEITLTLLTVPWGTSWICDAGRARQSSEAAKRHDRPARRLAGRRGPLPLADLPRYNKVPWVFWNTRRKIHMRYVDFYWREFQPEAGPRRVRLHDLRHTFASHAAISKEILPMIGRLRGHTNPQSTSPYAHLDDEHVLDAAEQIGAAIERLLN